MKRLRLNISASLAMVACIGLSGCAVTDGPPNGDSSNQATVSQAEEADTCAALDACIDTAQRDGNYFLIPECLRILGPGCKRVSQD